MPVTLSTGIVPANTDPFVNLDGRLDPGCTVLYPTLFTSPTALPGGTNAPYAFRPAWKVPGVDYGIGPRCSTIFKTPGVDAPPAGVTVNGSPAFNFTITADNVVIDGWDFTVNGGWQVLGGTIANNLGYNPVISNCKFKVGTNGQQPIRLFGSGNFGNTATGSYIHHCLIDGNNVDFGGNSPLLDFGRPSPHQIEHNLIGNAGCDLMDLGGTLASQGGLTGPQINIRWNVFQQSGQGAGHPDWFQTDESDNSGTGPSLTYGTINIEFNLGLQWSFPTTNGSQGFTLDGNTKNPPTLFPGGSLSRNVFIVTLNAGPVATGGGGMNWLFRMADDCDAGPWSCNQNYIDPSGLPLTPPVKQFCFRQSTGSGPYLVPSVTCTGNLNMIDGTSLDNSF